MCALCPTKRPCINKRKRGSKRGWGVERVYVVVVSVCVREERTCRVRGVKVCGMIVLRGDALVHFVRL